MANEESGWGGARPGAGRPPKKPKDKTVTKSFSLERRYIKMLEGYAKKNGYTSLSKALQAIIEKAAG